MIVLQAQEQERRLDGSFSAGEPAALRSLLFRLPEHVPQVSDLDPPVSRAVRASAKGVGTTTTPLQRRGRTRLTLGRGNHD